MDIIDRTLLIMAALWLFVLFAVGFLFGFGAFLALIGVVATLCWCWQKYMPKTSTELRLKYVYVGAGRRMMVVC
jgi:hypothetical protein